MKKSLTLLGLLFAVTLFAGRGKAAADEYRLAPGDAVHVQVLNYGLEEFSSDLTVQPDGRVKLPIKPPRSLMASGLTLVQFERALQRAYATFIRNPVLVVSLKSHALVPQFFYLAGAFAKNGVYPLVGRVTALEALSTAGGAPGADLTRVTLIRGRTSRILNLLAAQEGSVQDNVVLRPDDQLFVPQAQVTVQGQVVTSRNIDYRSGMSLEQALAAVGGTTDKADLSRVRVTHRDGVSTIVDLKKSLAAGQQDPTVLQPDDIITVPEAVEQVLVLGAVARTTPLPYRPNLTLDTAIALAGGESVGADLSHVKIAHVDPPSVQTVDLQRARTDGVTSQVVLQPGDVITIPQQTAEQVFLLGAVTRPGPVAYHTGMMVMDLLGPAGSFAAAPSSSGNPGLTDAADLYHAVLTHVDGEKVDIDLDRLLRRGDMSQNLPLKPGDTLYVPESQNRIYVFGAVQRPGTYVVSDKDRNRLLDVLQLAGGPSPQADLSKTTLVTSVNGKSTSTQLNVDAVMRKGDLAANLPVPAGSVLFVPQRGEHRGIDPLQAASLLLGVVSVMRR